MHVATRTWIAAGSLLLMGAIVSVSLTVAVAQDRGGGYTDPDAGLSDEARNTKYSTASAESALAHASLVKSLAQSGAPVDDFIRVPVQSYGVLPPGDLKTIAISATDIFLGTVEAGQRIDPDSHLVVSGVDVESWLKGGGGGKRVEIEQIGIPELDGGGKYLLGFNELDPVPHPGDRIIVFTNPTGSSGRFRAIHGKTLNVVNGLIEPNPVDPEFAITRGLAVEEVLTGIRSATPGLTPTALVVGTPAPRDDRRYAFESLARTIAA